MNFTTKIPIAKSNNPISYSSKMVLIGSCFAENIGAKFEYFKFQNTVNPFGIIFNPVAVENLISRAVNEQYFTKKDLFFHNEQWHCFEVHSDLSNSDNEHLLQNLNRILVDFKKQIIQATHIIMTYGTAWVYKNKVSNDVVANCHKVPQNQFDKGILSVEIIEKSIQNTLYLIQKINPNCNVIFTVSPVRHIKDGFVENQRSKAHLIAAIHSTQNSKHNIDHYFPAYEIMMDELRDYRFYADDMLHPNSTAINYIWERFVVTSILEENYLVMDEVGAIQRALSHRAFNPDSQSHLKFVANLKEKINILAKQYPQIKF